MSQLLISDKLGQDPLAGQMLSAIEYPPANRRSSTQVGVVDADGST